MKLRIRDNSVRLRLERGEVDILRDNGIVSSRTGFPGGREFRYAVESSPAIVNPAAFFSDVTLTVRLPETMALGWANSAQVSIVGEQRLDDGTVLGILVEKDFACLAPREGEDDTDMFPHPDAASGEVSC
ncbi:MAG: hypothetical protein O2907_00985 [Proteobacteria bacterium]|nr:hypothetical protein [Pseudomonadota bacterium]MDA1062904.1 hypothetical protein [Pseudomonadota bacterium]